MQKAVRLNILARNSAAKASRKAEEREAKEAWKEWHQVTNRQKALQGSFQAEERLIRRQDWIAGPLAPNRNSGTQRGKYGTVDFGLTQLPTIPKSVREGPKREGYAIIPDSRQETDKRNFKGRTIVGNVIEGDKVVIVAGPERLRGLIGYVNSIDLDREEVKLRNINTVDVAYPPASQPPPNPNNPEPAKYTSINSAIPMSHVRLVVTPTNSQEDIIVRHVHAGPPYEQQEIGSNIPSHTRYVTGAYDTVDAEGNSVDPNFARANNIEIKKVEVPIPWPTATYPDSFEHFEGDTQRTALSRPTWNVSMFTSPLGYKTDVPKVMELGDSPYTRATYLSTIDVKGPSGLQNIQRAGLDGYVSDAKLQARFKKISAGILNELRDVPKSKPRYDDADFVKRQMIEDARAIWYQDRKLISPKTQAIELGVEQKAKERQKKMIQETSRIEQVVSRMRGLDVRRRFLGKNDMQGIRKNPFEVHGNRLTKVFANPERVLAKMERKQAKMERKQAEKKRERAETRKVKWEAKQKALQAESE